MNYKSIADIASCARVAMVRDPTNQGRGVSFLAAAGMIQLKPDIGAQGKLDDVKQMPRQLTFIKIEGPKLVRAISDVYLAQECPNHDFNAGRGDIAGKALLFSGADDLNVAIRFVSRHEPLLHKAFDTRGLPFHRRLHATAFVTGMPSAVSPFSMAMRIGTSATCRLKSRALRRCPSRFA